jgi:hypothetical protein
MTKLYFIKRTSDGKYLDYRNVKEPNFVTHMMSATPSDKFPQVANGLEVEEIDMEDFKTLYSLTVSELIIIGELFYRKCLVYNDTIPVLPKLNKTVRQAVRNAISKMSFFHEQTNEFIAQGDEDMLFEVSGQFEELITNVSEALKGNMEEYNEVLKAMKKDPKSILGIAKKVNNGK